MRYIFPAVLGLCGVAVLVALGLWQVQRLGWKEAMIAQIEARIEAAPQPIPAAPDPEADKFMPVQAAGQIAPGGVLRVLGSMKQVGAIHRYIAPLALEDGRRVLVDLGYREMMAAPVELPSGRLEIIGNLHWPDEVDSFTPDPDGDLWFARDVPAMASALGTLPVLVVAREITPPLAGLTPGPVTTVGIPNDHLEYAMTWFGLAIVWLGMTLFLMWRIKRRTA